MPGGIFISYRRQDTSDFAGRLYDRLANRFGEDQVFMDVDTIQLGVDFAEAINRAVGTCEVLLAVIGPGWVTATDKDGRRRLDDLDDVVRLEVEAALDRGVRVIPVLVGGAVMPHRGELPESLAKLARRNGLSVRHDSFRSDVARLVAAIERIEVTGTPAAETPSSTGLPESQAVTAHDTALGPPASTERHDPPVAALPTTNPGPPDAAAPPDPPASSELDDSAQAYLVALLGRIKHSLRDSHRYWGNRNPTSPLKPFVDLERDLLRLEQVLEALPFPRDQAPEVLKPLLADRKVRTLVTRSAVELTTYVAIRKRLIQEAPKQRDPDWLLGESRTAVQALDEVRRSLGPLKQAIERLTPRIP